MDLGGKVKRIVAINGSHKLSLQSLIITMISAFMAYHLLIIHGFTNPDGICEGLTFYTSGDWALAGCGRWAIRYMNELTCNIVIPLYVVSMYGICIWLSIVLLSKLWKISTSSIIVLSIVLIVTPAITQQMTYTYTALAYAFSCLLSVIFVYVVFRCNWKIGMIGGVLSSAIMIGLYQSYVGMVAVLVLMTIIVDLIDLKEVRGILKNFGVCALSSLIGFFLYIKILEFDLAYRGLDNSGTRVSEFDINAIFLSFFEKITYVYTEYFNFFKDTLMHRNIIYIVIAIISIIALVLSICYLLRKKEFIRSAIILVLYVLIPFASNIIAILIPYNELSGLMCYQTILIIPFMLACMVKIKEYKFYGVVQGIAVAAVGILAWTYILGANATFKCYELSYRYINSQMQIALTRVYDLDEYVKDETPILIAGFPNDSTLRNNLDIYQYGKRISENPAFWLNMHGATQNRYLYFMDYFGIDAKRFSDDEYAVIINTSEFEEMPVWPDKDSVKMIEGFAVVKFTEEPPMP